MKEEPISITTSLTIEKNISVTTLVATGEKFSVAIPPTTIKKYLNDNPSCN
jgi:hypothetical protein